MHRHLLGYRLQCIDAPLWVGEAVEALWLRLMVAYVVLSLRLYRCSLEAWWTILDVAARSLCQGFTLSIENPTAACRNWR